MLRKIKLVLIVLVLTATSTFGQSNDSLKTENNKFIRDYSKQLSLKTGVNDDIESFEVRTPGTSLDLRPNTSLTNSYTLAYEFIVFTFSFNPAFINVNSDNELRGSTKVIRYATNLTLGSHFNQYLSFQKIRGYYLNNTSDFDPSWEKGQPYIQFPKLNYLSWHGATTYQPDPRYSLFAAIEPKLRQVRSAGSPLFNFSYNYYIIDDRTLLSGTNSSQRSQNLELLPSIGYGHTFVFNRFFYTMMKLDAGVGKIHTKLLTRLPEGTFENKDWSTIIEGAGTVAFGYDNGRFFTGGEFSMMRSERIHEEGGAAIFGSHTTFEIFFGYRFNPPGFLRDAVDSVKGILPNK